MIRYTRKTKSMKDVLKYETIPENKSRRIAIPDADKGQAIPSDHWHRRAGNNINRSLRSSRKACKLGVKKMKDNTMLIGVSIFLVSIWASGFMAHAGMRFESLLTLVVGFIFLVVSILIASKK